MPPCRWHGHRRGLNSAATVQQRPDHHAEEMHIEPWLGAIIGTTVIGIGLIGSLITVLNRLVKLETKETVVYERLRKIESTVLPKIEDRLRELEIRTGMSRRETSKMHHDQREEGNA